MSGPHVVTLNSPSDREKVSRWAAGCVKGTRVEFRGPRRSTDQNSLLWGILSDVAEQKEHGGRKYDSGTWKVIFMSALGCELQFVPSLDGNSFLPLGHRSSKLSKAEMTDLIESIIQWGTENGVRFSHLPPLVEDAA